MPSRLLSSTDAEWNAERGAFNVLLDQQPAGIAVPRSADEVIEVVRSAKADGKRVAAQRTGHAAAPLGDLGGTVLIRTAGLGGVEIDADAGTARVGAGALWSDLVPQASEAGLAALHGSTTTVGIVGYTLGGGVGWYGREHGLACNRASAAEIVSADGELRRVDAENDPDLFWALRGGGGSFGIVTALEFELIEVKGVYAGALFFPQDRAGEVFDAWVEWIGGVPDAVTSVARMMNFPPLEPIPEPFRGKSFAIVEAVFDGEESAGAELIEPLRALGADMDTFATVPPAGISDLHMDPQDPSPYASAGLLLEELPSAGIEALLGAVGPGSGSPLVSVEVRHCGGAMGRAEEGAGALARLPGEFLAFGVGIVPVPEAMAPTVGFLEAMSAALAPYDAGAYVNFSDDPVELTRAFPAATVERLRLVKSTYDPEDLFHANHPVTS